MEELISIVDKYPLLTGLLIASVVVLILYRKDLFIYAGKDELLIYFLIMSALIVFCL